MRNFLIVILLFLASLSYAGHNRGIHIAYSHVAGNQYKFTVTLSAVLSSPADRPEIEIDYGDGQIDTLPRISIYSDITFNCTIFIYEGLHTYSGTGIYNIIVKDATRESGIINIPSSNNEGICVSTQLIISPFFINNSVVLDSFPCPMVFCEGQLNCEYLPVFDSDGDSLSYSLLPCTDESCDPIGNYQYPGSFGGNFSLNQINGEVCWDFPPLIGDYNIAVKITEWKSFGPSGRIDVGYSIIDYQLKVITGCVTSLPSSNSNFNIAVYPNPFDQFITIEHYEVMQAIKIFDLTGKLILESILNSTQIILDMHDIIEGIYIIEVRTKDKVFNSKISKN